MNCSVNKECNHRFSFVQFQDPATCHACGHSQSRGRLIYICTKCWNYYEKRTVGIPPFCSYEYTFFARGIPPKELKGGE